MQTNLDQHSHNRQSLFDLVETSRRVSNFERDKTTREFVGNWIRKFKNGNTKSIGLGVNTVG